jgi:hypothetical protein
MVIKKVVGSILYLLRFEFAIRLGCCTNHPVIWCGIPEKWRTQLHHCEGLKAFHGFINTVFVASVNEYQVCVFAINASSFSLSFLISESIGSVFFPCSLYAFHHFVHSSFLYL